MSHGNPKGYVLKQMHDLKHLHHQMQMTLGVNSGLVEENPWGSRKTADSQASANIRH